MVSQVLHLYNEIYMSEKKLVSIIIPTKDNAEALVQSLYGALKQDYKKIEVIVSDSGKTSVKPIIDACRKKSDIPIKHIKFDDRETYSLAEARNRAIIEAEGDYLVFCDDRIQMDERAVSAFMAEVHEKMIVTGKH